MYGITMIPPLKLLKRRYERLYSLLQKTESPELAFGIRALLEEYREAIKTLEA